MVSHNSKSDLPLENCKKCTYMPSFLTQHWLTKLTQPISFKASGQLKLYVGPDGSVSLDNRASKKNYEQVVFDRDGTRR